MQNANEYKKSNNRHHCKEFLREFGIYFNWKLDGTDSMLDIGCGPGEITIEVIEPLLPKNYERLIGLDISECMIEDAKKNYENEKVKFILCDIECELSESMLKALGTFDHVVTLKTLMWFTNWEFALKNIYKLLNPGGDFVLSYFTRSLLSDLFATMSKSVKWEKYYKGIRNGQMHSTVTLDECLVYLIAAGFILGNFREKKSVLVHTIESFQGLIKSIDPVINNLSTELREVYLKEITDIAKIMTKHKYPGTPEDTMMVYIYEVMGYVTKP